MFIQADTLAPERRKQKTPPYWAGLNHCNDRCFVAGIRLFNSAICSFVNDAGSPRCPLTLARVWICTLESLIRIVFAFIIARTSADFSPCFPNARQTAVAVWPNIFGSVCFLAFDVFCFLSVVFIVSCCCDSIVHSIDTTNFQQADEAGTANRLFA